MKNLLFTVEDTFEIRERGLILTPTIPKETSLPKAAIVSLLRPYSSVLKVKAVFEIPFLKFFSVADSKNHEPAYHCILLETGKEQVPIGTEVWLD